MTKQIWSMEKVLEIFSESEVKLIRQGSYSCVCEKYTPKLTQLMKRERAEFITTYERGEFIEIDDAQDIAIVLNGKPA